MSYQVQTMSRAQIELTLDWAAAEGWNPGLHDATPFHVADPAGFLVGLLEGEPAATISVVRYPGELAFLGCFIVSPDRRGQGLGRRIWEVGLGRVAGCVVGLDGVVAQQASYRRSGFVHAWPNFRFGGTLEGRGDAGLRDVRDIPFDQILALDRAMFRAARPAFLAAWLAMPESRGLALVEGGELLALGVIRRCRHGRKIGPLYAPDRAAAERVLFGLAATAPGEEVFLDVAAPNAPAMALAESLGLTIRFETARMYLGPPPSLPLDRTFGITTFELG